MRNKNPEIFHFSSLLMLTLFLALVHACSGSDNNQPSPPNTPPTSSAPTVSFSNAALEAYLKASNAESGDTFAIGGEGRNEMHVSLSGNTLALGMPGESSCAAGINGDQTNNGCFGAGAVYVFTRTSNAWIQQAYVKASNPGGATGGPDGNPGDGFGASVAISGDMLAVGAPLERSCATGTNGTQSDERCLGAGAVYVFIRSDGVWRQEAYIKASNTREHPVVGENAQFGRSVAINGTTLAVGAPAETSCATAINGNQADTNCPGAGAAYVFIRASGTWSQQSYVKASNTQIGDAFGWGVAVSGDTLTVTAPLEDSCATGINGDQSNNACADAGAGYVFGRSNDSWAQESYIKASNADRNDEFGQSVAVDDDTLVIGAHKEGSCANGINGAQLDNSCFQAGAAYIFTRGETGWSQQAYVKASNTETGDAISGDRFGWSVAISDDIVAVGAPSERSCSKGIDGNQSDNGCSSAGATYIFATMGDAWRQQAYMKASNTDQLDQFGFSLALDQGTLAASAPGEASCSKGVNEDQGDNSCGGSGAGYVYVAR